MYSLTGHTDTPTSLSLSPNGNFLLSPSFSSQVLIHDVRPFAPNPSRVYRTLLGSPAGFESTLLRAAWSKDDGGQRVAVGSADRSVCIWEMESGKILYKVSLSSFFLPGMMRKFMVMDSFLGIRVPSRRLTSIQKSPSVSLSYRDHQISTRIAYYSPSVLTGSKDATMLLGEIEPGLNL